MSFSFPVRLASTIAQQAVPLNSISEHSRSALSLHQTTLFPYTNPQAKPKASSATLSFRFRSILFDKKRSLAFFLALELLTGQKPVAVLAHRNLLTWKIRKGALVGCRVTLRGKALDSFLDTLSLIVPTREKLTPFYLSNRIQASIVKEGSFQLLDKQTGDAFRYSLQQTYRLSALTSRRTTSESFRLSELPLFPQFERAFGLHPDVQSLSISISLSSRPREERLLLFRTVKFPIL
jgi:hypothetical protein